MTDATLEYGYISYFKVEIVLELLLFFLLTALVYKVHKDSKNSESIAFILACFALATRLIREILMYFFMHSLVSDSFFSTCFSWLTSIGYLFACAACAKLVFGNQIAKLSKNHSRLDE